MNPLYFREKILSWYEHEKRDLPWRKVSDPYLIWISEVILQQTRINQGINYYYRFAEKFPNVQLLAQAHEDEVLKMWQGLGYYSRARNLLLGAQQIVKNYDLNFPNSFVELKKIKGIGDYTAAAIASIAFNEPVAAVDGNVYRVLSRIFGIDTPIDSTIGKKEFNELANQLLDKNNAGDYNQAVMEFGALHCTPKQPLCVECIFKEKCIAYNTQTIARLPVKSKKAKQRRRYFYYFIVENKKEIYFKRRVEDDIWKNLFDFPLIETSKANSPLQLFRTDNWKQLFNTTPHQIEKISEEFIHILSHQRIHVQFYHISINPKKKLNSNFIKIDKRNIFDLAIPRIIENYLNENGYL